jgi:hypothetical protein
MKKAGPILPLLFLCLEKSFLAKSLYHKEFGEPIFLKPNLDETDEMLPVGKRRHLQQN